MLWVGLVGNTGCLEVSLSVVVLLSEAGCQSRPTSSTSASSSAAHFRAREISTGAQVALASSPSTAKERSDAGLSSLAAWSGRWQVDHYAWARVSAIDDRQAHSWVGHIATITSDRIVFHIKGVDKLTAVNINCSIHHVSAASQATDDYVLPNNVWPVDLGIDQPTVLIVSTDCDDDADDYTPFGKFVVLKPDELLIEDWGVFFFLKKMR
jgi:hypothetical protein